MTHPNRRGKLAEVGARRREVARLILSGISNQNEIAQHMGVDRSTISRDMTALETQWREEASAEIATARAKDLARIETLISSLWSDAQQGVWAATSAILSLMQHRAKLLGLEAPSRSQLSHSHTRIEIIGVADEDMP